MEDNISKGLFGLNRKDVELYIAEIRSDYEYSEDKDGNKFCSDECAKGFYGIRNMCVV